MSRPHLDMEARYRLASTLTPVIALPRTPTANFDGYWIDRERFFFTALAEQPGFERLVDLPHLLHAPSGEVDVLLSPQQLAALPEAPDNLHLIARYDLPSAERLVIEANGHAWFVRPRTGEVLGRETLGPLAIHSPDGRWSVVQDGWGLSLIDRASGERRPLPAEVEEHHALGRLPENETAPIAARAHEAPVGVWSADSRWFLTHQVDERGLPESGLVQHAPPGGGPPVLHRFKLSAVGDPLPRLRFVAFEVVCKALRISSELQEAFSPFGDRSAWVSQDDVVCFLRRDRYRRWAELVEWRLSDGIERVRVREDAEAGFIDVAPIFGQQPLARRLSTGEILWWSERDGYGHLYLYPADDGPPRQLTRGAWPVRDVVWLDERRRQVTVTAGQDDPDRDPADRRLLRVGLDDGVVEILESPAGDLSVRPQPNGPAAQDRPHRPPAAGAAASPDGRFLVARISSLVGGSEAVLIDLRGGPRRTFRRAPPLGPPVRPLRLLAADGKTPLHGVLVLPSDFDETRSWPLLDFIYPGPQQAMLPHASASRAELQARAWAELGMVVLMMDSRHMPLRSRAVHQDGHGAGQWEPQLADHAAAVEQLCRRFAFIDRSRLGMIGISGGGAATAAALLTYPDVWRVGVSAAGNHDSSLYRSIWLDQYLGPVPPESLSAHANSAAADRLQGDLMLVTGDMDDNVLISQTLAFADALIRANKDFELIVAPNEGHLVLVNSAWVQRRVWDFLARRLIGTEPPRAWPLAYDAGDKMAYARALSYEFAAG